MGYGQVDPDDDSDNGQACEKRVPVMAIPPDQWRESEIQLGRDPDGTIEAALRETGKWPLPGQVSRIHDHGGAVTVSTVLSGAVFEERFERTSGRLVRPTWAALREAGAIDPIDPRAIHRVRPVGSAVTLHLYLPACADGQIYQAEAEAAGVSAGLA